jgi:hypothetical protein
MQTNVFSALYRQKLKLLHSFKQMEISARGYADKIVCSAYAEMSLLCFIPIVIIAQIYADDGLHSPMQTGLGYEVVQAANPKPLYLTLTGKMVDK